MKIVIVGGKLQGLEAAYLARQAGWDTVLVDKNRLVPAIGLCDEYHQLDVTDGGDQLKQLFRSADLVIPTLENQVALRQVGEVARAAEVPLAFDSEAYAISSSKLTSDRLFRENGIQAPIYWPLATLPVIVKPSGASGSQGVQKIQTEEEMNNFRRSVADFDSWVIQEFVQGPSYSLEVIGLGGSIVSYQVTELIMDASYDCKRVLAPASILPSLENQLRAIAVQIGRLINLTGIMDIEVVDYAGSLKVLEIDARLPSQTPATVWHSTGVNMLEHLRDVFVKGRLPKLINVQAPRDVIFEHLEVSQNKMECLGEHIMAVEEPLHCVKGFWGAYQALTNYQPGRLSWVATLIFTGNDRAETEGKRRETLKSIQQHFRLTQHLDNGPELEVI